MKSHKKYPVGVIAISLIMISLFSILLGACAPTVGIQVPMETGASSPAKTPQGTPPDGLTPQAQPASGTPQDGSTGEAAPLVEWQRSGGIAGRCRHLTVYPDHRYLFTDCLEKNTLSEGQLTGEQMAYLSDLAGRFGPFRWESRPPKRSADMFLDWYIFNGAGTESPSEAQMQEINNRLAMLASKLTSTQTVTQSSQGSGIRGRVLIGPSCPGPVREGATECSDLPYQARLAILDANDNPVTEVQSDANGVFQVALQPGTYIIRSLTEGRFPVTPDQTVSVPDGQYVEVTIQFDTGIR